LFILFIFCECLLVVHLLTSLVNSIHRNLLCQVAKLLSVVQHTVSVVAAVVSGLVVGPVRVVTIVGPVRVVAIVVGPVRVVTIVGPVRVVAIVVGLVGPCSRCWPLLLPCCCPVRVVAIVVGLVVGPCSRCCRCCPCSRCSVVGLVVAVVGLVVAVVVGLVRVVGLVAGVVGLVVAVVTPGSHAILITGIFEGFVQRRRSVEIIISLVGVCLIIHLV
jgi:hypothetical protein